jgi:hypothetical protein
MTSLWPAELLKWDLVNSSPGAQPSYKDLQAAPFLANPLLSYLICIAFRSLCFHTADTLVSVDTLRGEAGWGVKRGHALQCTGLSWCACIGSVPLGVFNRQCDQYSESSLRVIYNCKGDSQHLSSSCKSSLWFLTSVHLRRMEKSAWWAASRSFARNYWKENIGDGDKGRACSRHVNSSCYV